MDGKTMALALALALMAAGCGEKKRDNTVIATRPVETKPSAPVKMQEYKQTSEVEWGGKNYLCDIRRAADDSLKMVSDESGQKYVDNKISLRITRADGSVFFQRTFTKASFSACLNDDYRSTGILEGLVFYRVEGSSLLFAASVSHPGTDEYIPLVVAISRFGDVSVKIDDQLDTSGEESF